jgi:hypothetical protein
VIATVRIAPVERWCEPMKAQMRDFPQYNYSVLVGLPIQIRPASMRIAADYCGGKGWVVEWDSVKVMDSLQGYTGRRAPKKGKEYRACEHFLEMD